LFWQDVPGETMRALAALIPAILAPAVCLAAQGEVTFLEGSASRLPASGPKVALSLESPIDRGDLLETGEGARLEITLPDKSVVRLAPSSRLRLDEAAFSHGGRSVKATLLLGKVWSKVSSVFGSERDFEVRTEHAVAGVRGTIFRVDADKAKAVLVKVYAGTVAVAGPSAPMAQAPKKAAERKQVPGPKQVDRRQWEKLVSAMMQVKVSAAGVPEEPQRFAEADEAQDAFALWNRERDPIE
jgi:hypothetical protein